jgi:ADP-dependent NAD(P)H-hydrate dehydratase / NAD(P)H-hydrate epimerase
MIVLAPDRMRKYDEYAIDTWGIPSAVLMENAGRSTYRLMKERYLSGRGRVAILCGKGNNGGDGFVIARYALRDGLETDVFLSGDPSGVRGDAQLNMELFKALGGKVTVVEDGITLDDRLRASDIVVDALFGTGLAKEVTGIEKAMIEAINRSGKAVIAVDIPSGLDGLKGVPLGVAVNATHTYTYGYPKIGLLLHPGLAYRGRMTVVDISLPTSAEKNIGTDGHLVDGSLIRQFFRQRPPDGHKGVFGHVGVIAGSTGKTGAAVLTALGALRIGAGLVTLATAATVNAITATKLTEAMTFPVADHGKGFLIGASYGELESFVRDKDVVVIGPGLGRDEETMDLVRRLFVETDKPFIIDADGIVAFAGHLELLKRKPGKTVLTPHPGEFGRLVDASPRDVNAGRIEEGRAFAVHHQMNLVLKGAPTVTFLPDGETFINPTGNAALAKGGTGDVLTGFIGGLAAQGYTLGEAALFGVYLHGYVADSWVEKGTDMDLLAGDLITGVGQAIRDIKNGTDRVYFEKSL